MNFVNCFLINYQQLHTATPKHACKKNGANAKKAGFLHAASFLYESLHESVRLFVKSAEKAKKGPQALAFPAVAVYNIK